MGVSEQQLIQQLLTQRSSLLAYIWTIVHDSQLAEDVYQEVALIAVEYRPKMRSHEAFPAWLRETARRQSLAALRKSSRQPVFSDAMLDVLDRDWGQRSEQTSGDMVEALHVCLPKLGSQARRVLALRYLEGLSGKEVARTVGREVNTVYMMLSRCHKTLRECIRRQIALEEQGR